MEITAVPGGQQELTRRWVVGAIVGMAICYGLWQFQSVATVTAVHHGVEAAHDATAAHAEHATHEAPPPAAYSIIPFAGLLLCIALLPLFHFSEEWWEHNHNRLLVAVGCGALTLLYFAFIYGHGVLDHTSHEMSAPGWGAALTVLKNAMLVEYIPFIVLLFSLYVISGGIAIEGHLVGRPKLNTGFIAVGALMASLIGTTGAAMLMIRPLLKANANRKYVVHTVIFFIFAACNTGGCLLPIGDPPLFLGFLRGVDFFWTLKLWPQWLAMNGSLLVVYYLWDTWRFRHEDRSAVETRPERPQPFAIRGGINFLWLFGVIFCVALLDPSKAVPGTNYHAPVYFREIVMLALTGLSLLSTSAAIRKQNSFNYDAIVEVAALFIGIFICMQAPIQILHTYGPSLGIDKSWQFYWGTGLLSSFLDNAPTYVVFFETAKTIPTDATTVAGVAEPSLIAISLGAVFMGAMTYIGNGPNFMVKSIAEKNNVRMPSFFGYMAYSCAVLFPLSLLLTWVFLV
ncbi:hypothetical protein Pan258_55300 [Symmachiella dynata]|uniref:sodium:proton antiporter n=1 Tax=Symmachiella dynata TaxID=2527995 RepID=UPI00118C1724|nr:sodium:proton antiporter [Symmachiella dynata]QDT51441.1 hypothetical protein Pan258_55300 [Symmachiella dynata]